MNYFLLGLAIIAGLFALRSVFRIVVTSLGLAPWSGRGGFILNAVAAGVMGSLAFWLWSVAA
jgi:hypothetical protein